MSEKQVSPTASGLSTPPPLRLVDGDASAGVCVDGYCVLSSAQDAATRGSADGEQHAE